MRLINLIPKINLKKTVPFSVIHESPDEFVDHLVEGEETNLGIKTSSVNLHFALKQDYEAQNLASIELRHFNGNPCEWPEFIENFRTRVHLKSTFDDKLRMERLCSVSNGETKKVIETIGNTGLFYATALKTLKRDFGNSLLISHVKLKLLFDQSQIKNTDRISLRRFHQQLKINNAWLLSILQKQLSGYPDFYVGIFSRLQKTPTCWMVVLILLH